MPKRRTRKHRSNFSEMRRSQKMTYTRATLCMSRLVNLHRAPPALLQEENLVLLDLSPKESSFALAAPQIRERLPGRSQPLNHCQGNLHNLLPSGQHQWRLLNHPPRLLNHPPRLLVIQFRPHPRRRPKSLRQSCIGQSLLLKVKKARYP